MNKPTEVKAEKKPKQDPLVRLIKRRLKKAFHNVDQIELGKLHAICQSSADLARDAHDLISKIASVKSELDIIEAEADKKKGAK